MNTTEQRSVLHILSDYEQTGVVPEGNAGPVRPPKQMDGYVRSTPVQPLRTDESFLRNRKRKIVRAVLLAVFIALVIVVIIRSGIINI